MIAGLTAALGRARPIYLPYVAISGAALAIDSGLFMILLALRMPPLLAATTGYLVGAVAHWLLSTRTIFARGAARGAAGRRQMLLYSGSGLLGLTVTTTVMTAATALGLDPRLAKLAAIVASFNAVYAMRRYLVFRVPRADPA